jgi:hypothetical protein
MKKLVIGMFLVACIYFLLQIVVAKRIINYTNQCATNELNLGPRMRAISTDEEGLGLVKELAECIYGKMSFLDKLYSGFFSKEKMMAAATFSKGK